MVPIISLNSQYIFFPRSSNTESLWSFKIFICKELVSNRKSKIIPSILRTQCVRRTHTHVLKDIYLHKFMWYSMHIFMYIYVFLSRFNICFYPTYTYWDWIECKFKLCFLSLRGLLLLITKRNIAIAFWKKSWEYFK